MTGHHSYLAGTPRVSCGMHAGLSTADVTDLLLSSLAMDGERAAILTK